MENIGGMLSTLMPILDYYIRFFTQLLTNFAASLGFDLTLPGEEETPEQTPEAAQ